MNSNKPGLFMLFLIAQLFNMVFSLVTYSYSQPYKYESPASKPTFVYDDLVGMIKKNNLKSVDEVIPKLPKHLRQNFTLMYHSLSLQESTVTHPRAILFGHDAKLIITFGGSPKSAASKNLEIMQFNDKTKTFSLHEVSFEDSLPHFATPEEIGNKCTSCHSSRPRPIWHEYKNWIGAYGEHDDIVSESASSGSPHPQENDYSRFRATTGQSPAFRSLYEDHEHDLIWPYSSSVNTRLTATMPNFRFNLLLTLLSGQQIAQQVRRSKLFPFMKYNLLVNYYCNSDSSQEKPQNILSTYSQVPKEEHWVGSRADWENDIKDDYTWLRSFDVPFSATGLFLDRSSERNGSKTGLTPYGSYSKEIDSDDLTFAYIAKHVAETDPILAKAHSGAFAYSVFHKDSYSNSIYKGFAEALKNSGLSRQFTPPCAYLKRKATEEVNRFNQSLVSITPYDSISETEPTQQVKSLPSAAIGRILLDSAGCIACHSSGLAPNISFSNPAEFKKQNDRSYQDSGVWLTEKVRLRISSPEERERMPLRGRPLNTSEQESLLMYLRKINEN